MTNLVTKDSFVGLIEVDTSDDVNVIPYLNSIITQKEPDIIADLFGETEVDDIYTKMQSISISNLLKVFRDGGKFTYNGETFVTKGLIFTLANFMYYYYQNTKITKETPTGFMRLESSSQDSNSVFDSVKVCNAWNTGNKESCKLHLFVIANPTLFQSTIQSNIHETINSFGI